MTNAAMASLFEKLIDENLDEPFEKNPKRFLTFNELQNSILNDLSRLLNTKVSNIWKNSAAKVTIPYSYGINITAPTSAESIFEIQALESRIDAVIRQFEPRLIDAKSHFVGIGKDPSSIFVNIDAMILRENRRTPLSFPVVVDI
jgi:type VI secretion system lysozyme-like protein